MINTDGLNYSQKQAVQYNQGPLMVLAGAGSGKTRTLVKKIIHLLEVERYSPFQILAVTFSNKAAREMRERVVKESSFDFGALQITTFHSFCANLLRSEFNYLGLSRNFTIYDDGESRTICKSILSRRGISTREVSPYELMYYFSELKNTGYYPGIKEWEYAVDKDDVFYGYYLEYESELHKSNAVDFGGLITGVIQLFEKYPEVLERYQKRFKYVLVDEYQDTNRAQFKLIKLLTQTHKNLCVVGDEDQSIYSWRGADIHNILDFEETYPDSKVIKLEQNYRSSKNIIEAASHVIARNQMRKGKELWTENDQGDHISITECRDDRVEAEYVVHEILRLRDEAINLDDVAVFYRNNSQSRVIEDQLRKCRVPYRVVAGIKFYERKEIKDLLSYMRVVVNSKDSLAFSRIINTPTRGIGATTLRKFEDEAVKQQLSLWEISDQMVCNPEDYTHLKISRKVRSGLSALVHVINECKVYEERKEDPSVIFEKLLAESGYLEFLKSQKDYESQARIENLEELLNAIKQYESTNEVPSTIGFLETITLDANREEENQDHGEVSLMTVHGSKGLEFPYVFITGVEENLFPSYKSLEMGEQAIEEERRLFYVAMTRAMKRLNMVFAQARMLFGSLKYNGHSRFIDEIPQKYYQWTRFNSDRNESGFVTKRRKKVVDNIDYDDEYSQLPEFDGDYNQDIESVVAVESKKMEIKPTYPIGSLVVHTIYGEGKVLNIDGIGNDEKVTIKFLDGEKKKFMVKFAPLTLL